MISDIQNIINESLADEVRKTILNEENEGQEVYHITCEGEPVDTFNTESEANAHLDIYKKKHPEKQFIIEKEKYNSYSEMIDKMEDLGEKLEVKETKTMEKKTVKVKNIAQAVLDAKEKGLTEFKLAGETYNVEETWKQLEEEEMCAECGDMNEESDVEESNAFIVAADAAKDAGEEEFEFPKGSGKMHKVTIKKDIDINEGHGECNECGAMLNEEGMCSECGSPMNESKKTTLRLTESELVSLISKMVNEAVPGLEITKKAQKTSGDESKSHMSDVEKSDYRGGGLEDLSYDYEPSDRFKERLKMALEGDPKMGNSQDAANVVKSDTGKKIGVKVKRKAEKIAKEPNISWGHSWKSPEKVVVVKESEKPTMSSVLEEEIKRMKKILGYDEKTQ